MGGTITTAEALKPYSPVVRADHLLIGSLGLRPQISDLPPDITFESHRRLFRNALGISGHISRRWQRKTKSLHTATKWDKLKHSKLRTEESFIV